MKTTVRRIRKMIAADCKANGVVFKLGRGKKIRYRRPGLGFVAGYFEDDPLPATLAVAAGDDLEEHITVLLHEWNHMQQWKEQAPVWTNLYTNDSATSADALVDEWLHGREFSEEEINRYIDFVVDVEMDCERRTSEDLKEFDLGIDVVEYIQKANAYVLYYNVMRTRRKWFKITPYRLEACWRQMPTTFDYDNRHTLTVEQQAAFALCY